MADKLKIHTRYRSCLWILVLTSSIRYGMTLYPYFSSVENVDCLGKITSLSIGNGLTCYCQGHCPNDNFNGTCEARPFSQCFAAVEEVYNPDTGLPEPEFTYGCLPPEEKGLMQVSLFNILFPYTSCLIQTPVFIIV